MISAREMGVVLYRLTASGMVFASQDQEVVWAREVNRCVPGAVAGDLTAACDRLVDIRRESGVTRAVSVPELVAAVEAVRGGDRTLRRERLDAEIAARGEFVPVGLGGEPVVEARWRRAAQDAVMGGACRAEAEAAAWAVVGRRPPALIDGPDVLGGLTGAERARAVLARLAAGREGADTSNRHGEGSGAAQNMPDAPREGWADSGPATGRTANRPVGRVIV